MLIQDQARDILQEVIRKHGRDLANDYERFQGLMHDRCGTAFRRESFCLVAIARQRISREISTDNSGINILPRLTNKLIEACGFDRELAAWGIEAWGLALGKLPKENVSKAFKCPTPACDTPGLAERRWAGKQVVCPRCKSTFDVAQDLTLSSGKTAPSVPRATQLSRWTLVDDGPISGAGLRKRIDEIVNDPSLSDLDKMEMLGFERSVVVFEEAALRVLGESQSRRNPAWNVRDVVLGAIEGLGPRPGLRLECDPECRRRILKLMPSFPHDEEVLAVVEPAMSMPLETIVVFGNRSFTVGVGGTSPSSSFSIPYGDFSVLTFRENGALRTLEVAPLGYLIPVAGTGLLRTVLLQLLNTIKHTLARLPSGEE